MSLFICKYKLYFITLVPDISLILSLFICFVIVINMLTTNVILQSISILIALS